MDSRASLAKWVSLQKSWALLKRYPSQSVAFKTRVNLTHFGLIVVMGSDITNLYFVKWKYAHAI